MNQSSGWFSRIGAGQPDLAHFFVHEALERVAPGGMVSFVLPRSVFKSPVGASVVRSGSTDSGRSFAWLRVVGVERTELFREVRSDAVIGVARADEHQAYPVPWESGDDLLSVPPCDEEDLTSPWSAGVTSIRVAPADRWKELRGRGGVNTGGGNGIFHVKVLGDRGSGLVEIENVPVRRRPDRVVRGIVESEVVRPLLKGADIGEGSTEPKFGIIWTHRRGDPRLAWAEEDFRDKFPLAYRFLSEFRFELGRRPEVARWGVSWLSLFRVDSYSIDCWRAVWPVGAGRRMRSAVLGPEDRVVPDQKVALVAFPEPEPAYFLSALLRSPPVAGFIAGSGGFDASPNLAPRVPLPRFDSTRSSHSDLAEAARRSVPGEELDSLCSAVLFSGRN